MPRGFEALAGLLFEGCGGFFYLQLGFGLAGFVAVVREDAQAVDLHAIFKAAGFAQTTIVV